MVSGGSGFCPVRDVLCRCTPLAALTGTDKGKSCVSYVELLIMYDQLAGHRLLVERVAPPHKSAS